MLGTSVLIPERLRPRPAAAARPLPAPVRLEQRAEIDAFAAELVDRFGALPQEVRHLLDVVEIKGLCRQAGLQQVDAGPKGAVIAFRKNQFANPEGLDRLHPQGGQAGEAAARPQAGLSRQLGDAGGAACRRARSVEAPGQDRGCGETGGVETRPAARSARAARGRRHRAGSASPPAAGRGICKAQPAARPESGAAPRARSARSPSARWPRKSARR